MTSHSSVKNESLTSEQAYQQGLAYAAGYHIEQDLAKAAHFFSIASERGHTKAAVNLAHHYYRGAGVSHDPKRAFELFSSSCQEGEVLGCKALATFYAKGEVVRKDLSRAFDLYQPSADKEDPEAILNQADILLSDSSDSLSEANVSKAITLINKAALLKYPPAIYKLGTLYYYGESIERDLVLAHAWVDIAAMMGNENAKAALPLISSNMSPEQLKQANVQSKELRQMHYSDIFQDI